MIRAEAGSASLAGQGRATMPRSVAGTMPAPPAPEGAGIQRPVGPAAGGVISNFVCLMLSTPLCFVLVTGTLSGSGRASAHRRCPAVWYDGGDIGTVELLHPDRGCSRFRRGPHGTKPTRTSRPSVRHRISTYAAGIPPVTESSGDFVPTFRYARKKRAEGMSAASAWLGGRQAPGRGLRLCLCGMIQCRGLLV